MGQNKGFSNGCFWATTLFSSPIQLTLEVGGRYRHPHSQKKTKGNHMSGGEILLPKFMPILFFRCVSRCRGVSGHLALQQGKSWCILECYPLLSLNGLKLCKSVSRSDLVLDAEAIEGYAGGFLSRLCRHVSRFVAFRQSGALLVLPCSHKNAVAQVFGTTLAIADFSEIIDYPSVGKKEVNINSENIFG